MLKNIFFLALLLFFQACAKNMDLKAITSFYSLNLELAKIKLKECEKKYLLALGEDPKDEQSYILWEKKRLNYLKNMDANERENCEGAAIALRNATKK